jgi:putative toxin-antitoxin system antitoxin component (TIGR02293 family)
MSFANAGADPDLDRTAGFLGGVETLGVRFRSKIEVHDFLKQGLPFAAVRALVGRIDRLPGANPKDMETALGMSVRTFHRRKGTAEKPLSLEQGSRAWKLAEVVSRAADILGSEDEARRWLVRPAMALDQRRPLDMLGTSAGEEMVDDLLTRMDHGVYT